MHLTIQSDGGYSPDFAAIGFVIYSNVDLIIHRHSSALEEAISSNHTEYAAMAAAVECAVGMGATYLELQSDSQLVIRQLEGVWKDRNDKFISYWEQIHENLSKVDEVKFRWIPRRKNRIADRLVRDAFERAKTKGN